MEQSVNKQTIIDNPQWQRKCRGLGINEYTFAVYLELHGIETPKEFQYNPLYRLHDNFTTAMQIAQYGKIPSQYWYHDPTIQNYYGFTVALYLACYGIISPSQWNHNPYIANYYEKTVQDYLIKKGTKVPDQWKIIDKQIQIDKQVQQYLKYYCEENNIENQQIVINYPQYQRHKYCDTFAVYLELHGIETPKEFQYDPLFILKENMTTAMKIAKNSKIPSQCWQYNSSLQDNHGNTVAMIYAYNGVIPPKEWYHDPLLKNNYEFTVQDYLQSNNIEIPNEWKTTNCKIEDKIIINKLSDYCKKYNINKDIIVSNPEWQDNEYQTFAMYLAHNGIIPPKQFIHNPNIKLYQHYYIVRYYLQDKNLPIPNEWYDNEYKKDHKYKPECVNDAFYGILTQRNNNVKSETQYESGWTVAMIYANQGVIPPKEWYHNPYITNQIGKTVQDYLQYYNKEIPDQWKAIDKQIEMTSEIQQQLENYCEENDIKNQQVVINYPQYQKCNRNITFAVYLEIHNIQTPKEFQYYPQHRLKDNKTTAMKIAQYDIIPQQYWNHNPTIQDNDGNTVAVYLEKKGIETPQQWQYDPKYRLNYKMTTAMKIAQYGKIPQQYWNHDPLLKDYKGNTVAIILSKKGIIPPKQWMHDINIINKSGESIRSNMLKYHYYYINNEFIKLNKDTIQQCIQNEILNDTCQICLEEKEQIFIKSTCNHRICLQCFKEMFKSDNYQQCPICRKYKWFKTNEQSQ